MAAKSAKTSKASKPKIKDLKPKKDVRGGVAAKIVAKVTWK